MKNFKIIGYVSYKFNNVVVFYNYDDVDDNWMCCMDIDYFLNKFLLSYDYDVINDDLFNVKYIIR